MDKKIGYFSNEQKQTLKLVGILSACVLVLLGISIALFYSLAAPTGAPKAQYEELSIYEGMKLSEAKAALDKANIYYEIIPTDSKTPNKVEKIEYLGKAENGKLLIEVGTSVKIHSNEASRDKIIYLTFDDGPTRDNTNDIVFMLEEYGIKASFFVEGRDIERYPDRMEAIFNRGHAIACHSYTHEYSNLYSSTESFIDEIKQYENALIGAIGEDNFAQVKKIIRFPGGTSNAYLTKAEALEYIAAAREIGYAVYDWTALTGDAEGNSEAQEFIYSLTDTLTKAKGKNQDLIVLLHDKWSTKEALSTILDHLISEGYYFDTIDNCPEYTFVEQ